MVNAVINEGIYTLQAAPMDNKNTVRAIKLEVGMKLAIQGKDVLNRLKEETYIKDNFQLRIKNLGDDWYSVYFGELKR